MKILNLGCGTKTCDCPTVINIDWSIYLHLKKSALMRSFVPLFIGGERLERFKNLPNNIVVHNLAKGIPFPDESVDAVYHSHMLEHLDKEIAEAFLLEVKRVLKPGGIHRIALPDLEKACKKYLEHISICEKDQKEIDNHESFIAELIEQSVRKEAFGTSQQGKLRRSIENFLLGDARKRGETHQWMYDRINLKAKLLKAGYQEVHVQEYNTSKIENWNEMGLDLDADGNQYKTESFYVEAIK